MEQDEPGVYITIRATASGGRELRRVRFRYVDFSEDVLFLSLGHGFVLVTECVIWSSRERFNEMHARRWWEENRSRVHKQYL